MLEFDGRNQAAMGGIWRGPKIVVAGNWKHGKAQQKLVERKVGAESITEANQVQSVRRKGGKKGKGHVYIICNLNPKHKQRQG